ncbi:MAG: SHOCT domain-containing protein [Actinomycetes bacterium]
MGYGWDGGGWGWGGWVFMAVMMVLFWSAIITGVVMFVRYSRERTGAQPPTPTEGNDRARQVLDERFARGEIDADEYTKRRDMLRTP